MDIPRSRAVKRLDFRDENEEFSGRGCLYIYGKSQRRACTEPKKTMAVVVTKKETGHRATVLLSDLYVRGCKHL